MAAGKYALKKSRIFLFCKGQAYLSLWFQALHSKFFYFFQIGEEYRSFFRFDFLVTSAMRDWKSESKESWWAHIIASVQAETLLDKSAVQPQRRITLACGWFLFLAMRPGMGAKIQISVTKITGISRKNRPMMFSISTSLFADLNIFY